MSEALANDVSNLIEQCLKKDKEIEKLKKESDLHCDFNNYLLEKIEKAGKEIERLNKLLEDIDTYIHLWELDDIGEKTMLILNDILLIKNGMSDEVVRLKEKDNE